MEKRIKIFRDESWQTLELMSNEFLQEAQGKLHEIFFNTDQDYVYMILVYTPEEGKNEHQNNAKNNYENKKDMGKVHGRIVSLREEVSTYKA